MEKIIRISTIKEYNALTETYFSHPLVTVVDLAKGLSIPSMTYNSGVYGIYLADTECGRVKYGRNYYTCKENSLAFTAPGQVMAEYQDLHSKDPKGMAILFHPDLIKGFALGEQIQNYTFFSYDIHEALNISDEEKNIIQYFFTAIQSELQSSNDKFIEKIIVGHIELLLTYCSRFFERQFISINDSNKGIKEKFEKLLNQYFTSILPLEEGLPSVSYFADKLHLSANYFGGVIKKETGCSAQEYIQSKIIDIAKERILNLDKSIVEVSLELGYKYPHHFSRLFKKKTGLSPIDYRENR